MTTIILIGFEYKLNGSVPSSKSKQLSIVNADQIDLCETQWEKLNGFLFFRPQLTFFYTDLSKLRLFFQLNSAHQIPNLNLKLLIHIRNSTLLSFKLNKFEYNEHHIHSEYRWMSMEANFTLSNFISNQYLHLLQDIPKNFELQVYIDIDNQTDSTRHPMRVKIKHFRSVAPKRHSLICSKLFYFGKNHASAFEWWIELNRMHGYHRLVIYNNSIEGSDKFDRVFQQQRDFVEIIQYQCIPNFIDKDNTNKSFIRSFNEFEAYYKREALYYHMHFEFITLNECYFENMDKYEYIAVYDQDESIIPRRIKNYMQLDNKQIDLNVFGNDSQCLDQSRSISSYMSYLKSELNMLNNTNTTFHFNMGIYLNHELFEAVIERFLNSTNNQTGGNYSFNVDYPNDINFKGDRGLNFNVVVKNEAEHRYAKYLKEFYYEKIRPFLVSNNLSALPSQFNRFFLLTGESTTWMCGKTIHNTRSSHWVSTHYPEGNNFLNVLWTPIRYGFNSHFRSSLKDIHEKNISISDFKFDLNYFLCYFKPLSVKLGYKMRF